MLADRQQLDVGVAQVADVVPQRLAQLPVGEEPVALLGDAPPRAQVDLVDRDGRVERVPARPLGHPAAVAPGMPVERGHDRRGARLLDLELEGEGIGLQGEQRPVLPEDLELVAAPLAEPGNEQLPDARARMTAHRVPPAVPGVEVAHDAHASGVRRPHGEDHARHVVEDGLVGAELLVGLVVRPLAEEEPVEVRQGRREPVGVLDLPHAPGRVGHRQAVPEGRRAVRERRLEDPVRVQALHLARGEPGSPGRTSAPTAPGRNARIATAVAPPSRQTWGPRTANGSGCHPATRASTSVTGRSPRTVEGPMIQLYAGRRSRGPRVYYLR